MNLNIPTDIKKIPNWVCWGVDPQNPKWPYNPNDITALAKVNDPTTWGTYETAIQQRSLGQAQGVGFMLDGSGIVAIDLDGCRDPTTGGVEEQAQKIVDTFDSFTEISMSGRGLHIFIRGRKPGILCKKVLDNAAGAAIELYDNGRYIAMTGNVYRNAPIAERSAELEELYYSLWPVQEPVPMPTERTAETAQMPDYYLAIGLEHDDTLKAYWNGQRNSADESSNDQGFMNKLAYWCNGDKAAMIKAFLMSPFAAQKDDAHRKKMQREDYLSRTADGAIAGCRGTAAEDNKRYTKEHGTPTTNENTVQALETFSLADLMLEDLPPLEWYVDGFIHQGLMILTGNPKSGKSLLGFDVCVSVTSGKQVLGRDTKLCAVLYLALEDSKRRLQDRAKMIMAAKGIDQVPKNFYLTIAANPIDRGLLEQLEEQLTTHPDIKLIVIDVMQRVRSIKGIGRNVYEVDSAELAIIKGFADKNNICILFIHHTRKHQDSQDPHQNISGSQAIFGTVDASIMLIKEPEPSRKGTINITSREMEGFELALELDPDCVWQDVTDQAEEDKRAEYDHNPVVRTIKAILDETPDKKWIGSATELLSASDRFGIKIDMTAQGVGYALRKLDKALLDNDSIVYTPIKSSGSTTPKKHQFYYLADYMPIVELDKNDAEGEGGEE